ncbi:hypothetical protein [Aestuariibaculum lutulentum]|nr:hypothetical protein [Aestuariibaculum lutulentum]
MKKYIKHIRTFLVLALISNMVVLNSCNEILDDYETDFGKGPVLATFVNTTDELNIIKDAENTPVDYEIPITFYGGRNVPLDKDLVLTLATSTESELQEGVEFELPTKTFTIPAGETTVNASVRVLTEPLVPFDFKDIVLEIVESTESIAENNKIVLTVKALDANTLAGTYEAEVGEYWNSGTYRSSYAGSTYVIAAIAPGLYRHEGIAFWPDDNDFYFTVDEATGVITVLPQDPEGEDTLLNGSPIMTCAGGQFEMVTCDETTNKRTLSPDGHHIVELTVGYFRGAGATREFLQKLVRL